MLKEFLKFSLEYFESAVSLKTLIKKTESILSRSSKISRSKCLCIANKSIMDIEVSSIDPKFVKVYHGEEEKFKIIMEVGESTRMLCRKKDEKLHFSLERIKNNFRTANAKLKKKVTKRSIKENQTEPGLLPMEDPIVELFGHNGEKIDGDKHAVSAWKEGEILKVCDLTYTVVCNPPKVESLRIVSAPIVGMPIHPQIQFREAALEFSRFAWFKYLPSPMEDEEMDADNPDKIPKPSNKRPKLDDQQMEWTLVGTDKIYVAKPEDVGCQLKVSVLPGNNRYPHDRRSELPSLVQEMSAKTEGVVIAGPKKCLFDDRHLLTTERCSKGRFRFVTYNILADVYASTEYAQDFLFPYCPTEAIGIDYRQQLVVKEITGYNADIICLQEVDRFIFESHLMPTMSIEGFAGAFGVKDCTKEGCALFYRREKFKLHMVDNIVLRKALSEERNKDLHAKLNENSEFMSRLKSRPTSLLIAILQSAEDPSKHIIIGNTHLYWHPKGGALRNIQMEIILREMRCIKEKFLKEKNVEGNDITSIVTGDLNSQPYTAVLQLLTSGSVPSDHADWYSTGKPEFLPDMKLRNPTTFESACGFPSYTNYVSGFQGCLDYIFIEPNHLSVERVIPPPCDADVTRFTALPNETAPSDHIAQVVDLTWKSSPAPSMDATPP